MTSVSAYAGSGATLSGSAIAWSSPGNATTSNNSYASATIGSTAGNNSTNKLRLYNFGFSIPTDATIDGIVVSIERKSSVTVKATDNAVNLHDGSSNIGSSFASGSYWPGSDGTATYGSSTTIPGGGSLTPTDINSSNFGVTISANVADGTDLTVYVDSLQITVYYTEVSAVTESATATESSDAAATVSDGVTESATASETGDATSALVGDVTESATATESSDGAFGPKQGDITETATATESSDAVASSTDSITESASATDTPNAAATANAGITETASATESSSASVIVYASASESAAATESSDGIAVGQLYREDATGFLVVKSGAGAGYTALTAPITAAAWRVLDIYGSTSAWHPSDDAPATESAAPFDPNYAASNDQNGSAISAPTIASDGTAVDHTISTDGTANMSFEWSWSGTESTIDGFYVFLYQSTSATAYTFGTTPAAEKVYVVPANKRAHLIYGVPANQYYTWGVQAFRNVAPNVAGSPTIKSTLVKPSLAAENPYRPSASVAYSGDVIGTIRGNPAGNLANVDSINSTNVRTYFNDDTITGYQLSTGAVSTTRGASGTVLVSTGAEVQTSSYSIPAVAAAVLRGSKFAILLVCNWRYNVSAASGYTITRRIKRGGTTIATVSFDASYGPHQSVMVVDEGFPATAAFSYTVHAQHDLGADVNVDSAIQILEFRKDG